ncbi:SDR family oxidoreductase [Halomonas organivorans]|uniref:NAD(P)-dependent dehydrogenase (Short-subunit alcohol dehydrogenase family) n=1 Tax=Halomonas organivorans TaxID=257772 RepID=A0A7W5G558_9GAMM|nr:SDR family oxidoreductase [Halomonas organivorans]MBB3140061.1 NAD(P)-dependent dehydrogenase (short-subunit alcohol dehydrogenase family) [Halomonas organivorans]
MNPSFHDLFDLSGRVAIVTGGLGILGRHFCRALSEYGAHVVVADLDGDAAKAFAEELEHENGVPCLGGACDVTREDSVEALVTSTLEHFGAIDILHNNAASKSNDLEAFFAPVEDYTLAEWRKIMEVNLDGVFLVSRSVGRRMIEQGRGGSIIHTGSIYGQLGSDPRIYAGSEYLGVAINTPPVYAASKAGVAGLARYLATSWAEHGIRVNTLVPGGIESGQNAEFVSRYSQRVPLQRMGHPDELVGALLFLASDASRYVTGQCLFVDGGLSAW